MIKKPVFGIKQMKVIFFGSSDYSVEILKALIDAGIRPVLVVTQPDRPKGRHLKRQPTVIKEFALKEDLEVTAPANLKDSRFSSLLKDKEPDFFLVVSYGKILPLSLLSIPKIMPLALHPSLLPKYRGPAPLNWVLINGEKKTGVCLFEVNRDMDAGRIIAQKEILIAYEDDYLSLFDKVYSVSREMIIKYLPFIYSGKAVFRAQDEKDVTFAPKIDKKISKIDWENSAVNIRNLVRGLVPYPCAWSKFKGKRIKFWEVDVESTDISSAGRGEIVSVEKGKVKIQAGKGIVILKKVQPEGRKIMGIQEFINGYIRTAPIYSDKCLSFS